MIKDRDIRDALETLDTEIENLEAQNKELEGALAEMESKVEDLEQQAIIDQERIKELEEALAEAYLTSETDEDGETQTQSGDGEKISEEI